MKEDLLEIHFNQMTLSGTCQPTFIFEQDTKRPLSIEGLNFVYYPPFTKEQWAIVVQHVWSTGFLLNSVN